MLEAIMGLMMQAAAPATPPAQSGPDIVVTGVRIEDTRAALDRCLARHCPPSEDIAATIAHAENLFVRGDYDDARTVLLASRTRNNRYASTLPVEVSNLNRASARIASLVGKSDAARIGILDTLSALKAGLPDSDPRVLMARLEVGDVFARQGRIDAAAKAYDEVAEKARQLNLSLVEGHALFRKAVLYGAVASVLPEYRLPARRAAERISATTDPALAPFRDGVLLLRARLDKDAGKTGAIDQALASFRNHPVKELTLVYAPVIDYQTGGYVRGARGDDHPQWIDVSFWVAPDGTVRDADILRRSDNFGGTWTDPVFKALKGRRYAPLVLDPSDPGELRVERYTLVSDLMAVIGTRILDRSANRHIEVIDLTAPHPVAHTDSAHSTAG